MNPIYARQKRFQPMRKPLLAAVLLSMSLAAGAQLSVPTDLKVERPTFVGQSLKRNHVLEVRLSRAPTPAEGQIAICIGPLDLSKQTKAIDATTFRAELNGAELPVGPHEVIVHLIRGNEWLDIAKFAVTVEPGREPEAKGIESRFTVGTKGQIHERVSGTNKPGARPQFQDMTATGGLTWEGKPLDWDVKSGANFTGVSRRTEAPRFGTEGMDATKIDLNDYKAEFTRGTAKFALGHVSYGNHPLLLNNRDSRGVSLGYAITPWLDVSASAIRATSIVGYDDFFGLATISHRIYAGTVGVELIPEKKGLLRTEFAVHGRARLATKQRQSGANSRC